MRTTIIIRVTNSHSQKLGVEHRVHVLLDLANDEPVREASAADYGVDPVGLAAVVQIAPQLVRPVDRQGCLQPTHDDPNAGDRSEDHEPEPQEYVNLKKRNLTRPLIVHEL